MELGSEHSETISRAWSHRLKMRPRKVTSNDGQSKKIRKKSDLRTARVGDC